MGFHGDKNRSFLQPAAQIESNQAKNTAEKEGNAPATMHNGRCWQQGVNQGGND